MILYHSWLAYKYCNVNRCSTVICLPCHYLVCFGRDVTSEHMAPWVYSSLLKSSSQLLFFVVPFYLFINYYYSVQFNLVTSRTKSLTIFYTCWGQVYFVLCVQVPVTLFFGRTPSGSIKPRFLIEGNTYC